eukprot:112624_1
MSSLFIIALLITKVSHITSATSATNDSFIPHDTHALVYSYLTPEQHYSIRRLNKDSQDLFVQLHASKSNEMNSWIQLRTFLSQLRFQMTSHSCVWSEFLQQLQQYTAFLQPFCKNYTADQVKMIEKLFCVIINNSEMQAWMQFVVAEHLHAALMANTSAINSMLRVFAIRVARHDSQTEVCLERIWTLAADEMRNTTNIDNRYTLFALAYMKWIIHSTITTQSMLDNVNRNIPQETADLMWNTVPDVEFFHYFLSFKQLVIHPIKNRPQLIAAIIDDVFAANGTFKPKALRLFCLRSSVLWDLNYAVRYAASSRHHQSGRYSWSSMIKFLDWIFEYKLSSGAYDVMDVMYLLIETYILSVHDILCETPTGKQTNISFDLLQYVIHCKETMEHERRLHHWFRRTGVSQATFCWDIVDTRIMCRNAALARNVLVPERHKANKYHSVESNVTGVLSINKTRQNRVSCCGIM